MSVFVVQPAAFVKLSILVIVVLLGTDGDNDVVSSSSGAVEIILRGIDGLFSGTHHTVIAEVIIVAVLGLEPSGLHVAVNGIEIVFLSVDGAQSFIPDAVSGSK